MVANANTLGPSIVALCLRAGWKLGGVTEMYHFRLDAGDLNVVRRAACLDIETKYYGYRRHISTVRTWIGTRWQACGNGNGQS